MSPGIKSVHYSHHYSHRGVHHHKISPLKKFNIYIVIPFLILAVSIFIGAKFFSPHGIQGIIGGKDLLYLVEALGASFWRLGVAYILALILGVLLALIATSSRKMESFLLPLFDILESVPILVFFPIIILFFISYNFFSLAAIFIIALNMIWNIVFNVINGIRLIPQDVASVGLVFRLNKMERFFKIFLPSVFPYIVTGSLLAWAEGWNMLIVAEVLKTYVPKGVVVGDLFGIGSVLVNSSVSGDSEVFLGAVCIVVVVVVLVNIFVWQPLLRTSEKYRFDS